jgi:hypothetical protein
MTTAVLRFTDDPDPIRFQYIYGALMMAAPREQDVLLLADLTRLLEKLDAASVPDDRALPYGLRMPRLLPGPTTIEITEAELVLIFRYLQTTSWRPEVQGIIHDTINWLLQTVEKKEEVQHA